MDVRVWEEDMVFPTYEVGEPDPNPMYLDRRVYQGSSGKVYPWPVIDRVADTPVDRSWRMVVLENQWLRIWILPALGGRIHRAYDKTNGYDFVYFNRVVKPALVGLAGPWISGGIEFNWPQHHRPSTYSPVDYTLRSEPDGGQSVVVSEIDRMYGTKGEAVFTLRPHRAVLEVHGRLYNPTPFPQTFLWWANPAVAVNDHTQSVFPPDVHAVMDHGKRDTSRFPIATGTYYKTDYSAGVDISRYKNIPVPTSYMVWKSDYDFVGGYDHQKRAGLLHVADHHVSPGKKQWTWGNGEFGRSWDRNLTDADGPYIELMTGVFTDNQPDFAWLAPQEEKTFVQHFLPFKGIGEVKKATVEAAVHLSVHQGILRTGVYVTAPRPGLSVEVTGAGRTWVAETRDLGPETFWWDERDCGQPEDALRIRVRSAEGEVLVEYQPSGPETPELPRPAQPIAPAADLADAEGFWLAGQHLEQYRHATFDPEEYYREGLRRFPRDHRLNGALGLLLLRRGLFDQAEALFAQAQQALNRYNTSPRDGEWSFHRGTALAGLGRWAEARDHWAKATWTVAWQAPAFLQWGRSLVRAGDFRAAEAPLRLSVAKNSGALAARHLLAAVLRHLGRPAEACAVVEGTLAFDPLDFGALQEAVWLGVRSAGEWTKALRDEPRNWLHLGGLYAEAGLWADALSAAEAGPASDPLLAYHRAWWLGNDGRPSEAEAELDRAARLGPDRVFPNRLEDLAVLDWVTARRPRDGRASLYRGNLLYDKKRPAEAAQAWAAAVKAEPGLATAWRNLALARFNDLGDPEGASEALETAVRTRPGDPRLVYEADQLRRRRGVDPVSRLAELDRHADLLPLRDDLAVEWAGLLNQTGRADQALGLLTTRRFHAWEGGEGKVIRQYVRALLGVAFEQGGQGRPEAAFRTLEQALHLPETLGEARLPGAPESQLWYFLGHWAAASGRTAAAADWWTRAAAGQDRPAGMMFYNDTPPEQIFYQGLARQKLDAGPEARERFHALVDFAEREARRPVTVDYFAVSLPDFLLFRDDLTGRNRVHCLFLLGLGAWGLGDRAGAVSAWEEAVRRDPNHAGALDHLRWASWGVLG